MRFHPDELRDQHNMERDGLDDLTDVKAAMRVILYVLAFGALFLALVSFLVWVFWPSQVPLTCQSYIGGEVVACAEGM